MKMNKQRFRILAGMILIIPPSCALVGLLAGLVGSAILRLCGVISHTQIVFLCVLFAATGLVLGIIGTAQQIRQALRVFRACDEVQNKKHERPVA
jgi:hypothetical protein